MKVAYLRQGQEIVIVYMWYLEYSINLYPRICNSLDYSHYMISNIECTLYLHRRHKRWGQEKKQAPRSRQGLQKKKRKRKMTGCLSVTSVWTQPKTQWSVCAATYSGKCFIWFDIWSREWKIPDNRRNMSNKNCSWPCLHQWLETRPTRQVCPVCKAAISKDKVIPLYGRGATKHEDPR